MGSGTLTLTCTGHFLLNATMTVIGNGSQLLVLNAGVSDKNFNNFGKNVIGTGNLTIGAGNVFNDFRYDASFSGGGNRTIQLVGDITINGTLVLNHPNALNNGTRFASTTVGTQRTVTLGPSSVISTLHYIMFEDIVFTGTSAPISGNKLGNIGNNSGITFDAPVTYYWIGGAGLYNNTARWSLTSGGASAGTYPLVHDEAIFDANSFTSAGQAVTLSNNFTCALNFTDAAPIPNITLSNPNGAGNLFCGSVILKNGMTVSGTASAWNFRGRRAITLSQNGATISNISSLTVSTFGNTVTLGSHLFLTGSLNTSSGSFDASGYNVTTAAFTSTSATTRSLSMGSGTWTLTGTGTIWNTGTPTNMTFDAGTSKLVISDTSATSKTIVLGLGSPTYTFHLYDIEITGGGSGAVIFSNTATRTFRNLTVNGPKTLTFSASATYLFTGNVVFNSSSGNVITLQSSTTNPFILSKPFGVVSANHLAITNSTVLGGASWYAGINSVNGGGNRGWQFSKQDSSKANFFHVIN